MRRVTLYDNKMRASTLYVTEKELPPVPEEEVSFSPPDPAKEFVRWFAEETKRRGLAFVPQPEQRRITRKLLRQYDANRLKELAVLFFQRYAEPLYEGSYDHPFILFASSIPKIEAELKDLVQ